MATLTNKYVEAMLENYHALVTSDDIEIRHLVLDLNKAIKYTKLTPEEIMIIHELYILAPIPPKRDKKDKNGKTSGRPPGGTTQAGLAMYLFGFDRTENAANIMLTKAKQSAIQKISDYLGENYQDSAIIVGD